MHIDITQPDDFFLHISSEMDILFMILAADAFLDNDHKPALFLANSFYSRARNLFDEIQVSHLERYKEELPKLRGISVPRFSKPY